jgi:C1A family cysteine protease
MRGVGLFLLLSFFYAANATLLERFNTWASEFGIAFEDHEHKDRLFSVWTENDKYIQDMNSRNLTYTLGHNQFSAMTSEEFSGYLGFGGERTIVDKIKNIRDKAQEVKCILDCVKDEELTNLDKVGCTKQCLSQELESDIPSEIDWVAKGAVTPVKNQGQCGSCWSFSTTGALEGAYYIKYGNLRSFSEQQLVDCDNFKNGGKDHGCNGGLMDNAFKWIEKNDGLCTESDYPYTSGETKTSGTCETSCNVDEKSNIKSFVDVPSSSDEDMMKALSQQPVSVAIQADQKDFQLYKSGVFSGSCGTKLDHGVLVVGYGKKDGADYYKLKNSWGDTWGDKGFIYIGRGKEFNDGKGQCGVLLQGSYPVL